MKTTRIILIVLLVLYGLGALTGAILSLFNPVKHAEMMGLGEMNSGLEKLLIPNEAPDFQARATGCSCQRNSAGLEGVESQRLRRSAKSCLIGRHK